MKIVSIITAITILFSSCYTYKIYPKEARSFAYNGERQNAYVLNPEISKEYQILKKSGIYNLVKDTSDQSVVKVRLYPLKRNFVCGEPALASLFTLGQFPVTLPDKYNYEFDEIKQGDTHHCSQELLVATRFWFWDVFVFKKNFNKKAGQALLAGYYSEFGSFTSNNH